MIAAKIPIGVDFAYHYLLGHAALFEFRSQFILSVYVARAGDVVAVITIVRGANVAVDRLPIMDFLGHFLCYDFRPFCRYHLGLLRPRFRRAVQVRPVSDAHNQLIVDGYNVAYNVLHVKRFLVEL